ncbi:MAG: (2Fe-2S)-binding protein, partial [Actinobacteria bacterium RBG_16_70_17]
MIIRLTVNGTRQSVEVDGPESLLHTLRESLGLPGSKDACEQGECGSCTVLLDGEPVCSCLVMAADADGADVVTVEGLAGPGGALHPVQQALLDAGAVQCGFCTPGVVMSAAHLLSVNPHPTPDEVREALAGNLCRCTGYGAIVRALAGPAGEAS